MCCVCTGNPHKKSHFFLQLALVFWPTFSLDNLTHLWDTLIGTLARSGALHDLRRHIPMLMRC
jgi:hypothetical protein